MLYDAINKLKANGVSIIYISHRLKEIFNICDRVTILRDGAKIDTKDIKDINMVKLVEMMTGKTSSTMYNRRQNMILGKQKNKKHLLEVKNISQTPVLKGVSFNLAVGEILGIVGLLGSGKTEIAKALFGIDPIEGGEIRILGKSVQINNPQDAIKCGINLVPEDRRIEGLILSQSVEANLTLPSLNILSKAGFISRNKSRTIATNHVKRLQIKTPGILQTTEFLSGGNQQKVVLGKWLTKSPQILLLDEPTVGIDVNAKAEVRKIISDHVNSNSCSVILFSSDLDEVIRIADRIIVMYQGKVFEEISNNPPIEEQVLHHTVQGAMENVH
jgi:ribose transport system ATP-binding protein